MTMQWLGQPTGSAVVRLTRGHKYRANFLAPVPCVLVQPQIVIAALQAIGSQVGQAAPWQGISLTTRPATATSCSVTTYATWDAPDVVIDPEVASLPGVSALPIQEFVDETTGEVLYDATSMPGPSTPPPGPAPGPPPSSGPPGEDLPKPASSSAWKFVAGAAVLALGAYLFSKR
jgi:hypothetical protein